MRLTIDLLGWTFDIGLEPTDDPRDDHGTIESSPMPVEPPPPRDDTEYLNRRRFGLR